MKRKLGILVFLGMVMGLVVLGCTMSTTPSASTAPSAPVKTYVVGETGPAGGLVFYDKGSYSGSPAWRYLESAPVDQPIDNIQNELRNSSGYNIPDPRITWNGNGEYVVIGASGTTIGTGKANTDLIVAAALGASTECAATQCTNSHIGGYSDWFLPSKDELGLMFAVYKEHTDLLATFEWGDYWSSTEYNDVPDWAAGFACIAENPGSPTQGFSPAYYKDGASGTRAIRRF